MARVAGIELPRNKRIEIALTYIFGIGRTAANQILAKANVDPSIKSDDLTADDQVRIRRDRSGLQGRRRSAARAAAGD